MGFQGIAHSMSESRYNFSSLFSSGPQSCLLSLIAAGWTTNRNLASMQASDQLGRSIEFSFPPRRIVSLVPSQSELLWTLGLKNEIVGITKFCIHPDEMFRSVTRVGGTKDLNFAAIEKLQPDLVIANKEENEKEQIENLCQKYPVWISAIYNLDDAFDMMLKVGTLTDREKQAGGLVREIKSRYEKFSSDNDRKQKAELRMGGTVTYLIWQNPYMAAGNNTFIDFMLGECGFKNVFTNEKSRYPEVTTQLLIDKKPDFVFLSSEPYPFRDKHIAELQIHLPQSKIVLVDGEMFSWYGSRLLEAFDYFSSLLKQLR
jgi:ABC-type Fe3+-hydroxamate transport system substrate-binding protein